MERTSPLVNKNEDGFTLVELAIVMIIIGLLITGILKGQEMIANAQVTATVAQVKGIDAATSTFRDIYDALPGDMATPATRLPNCAGTCANAPAANLGNGRVDTAAPGAAFAHASENRLFFTQLAAADLLSGVNPTPPTATFEFGEDLPAAEVGGGFGVGFSGGGAAALTSQIGGGTIRAGHYLVLSNTPQLAMGAGAGLQLLTPSPAGRIDRKLDDGSPGAGSVQPGGNAACITGTAYNEAVNQGNCNLYIRVQG